MKVLHINCNYLTTVLHQTMIEHLDEQGVESTVFAPTWSLEKAAIKPNTNVVAKECFHYKDRYVFHYKQGKIRQALEQAVDVSSFDCIHAYTVFTDGNCARTLSAQYGIPYVVAVRSTDVHAFFTKMVHLRGLGVRILRDAGAVFFLSEPYRQLVLRKFVPKQYRVEILTKSYIIGNGIDDFWHENVCKDTGMARLNRIAARELRLIYAGRINRRKNLPTTLKAVQILRERGYQVTFRVVGKVEDQEIFDALLKDPAVVYVKQQPKERLIEQYRKSDVFVMPSYKETFGLVYAEAMSQGLPVIYTRGQGFDGQIPEGRAGFSVNAEDSAEIADKIEKILANYADMSQAAIRYIDRFRWDDICQKYVQIYERILNQG
ncbi:MAG: glycosyltransferase family 4 protein [Lachnospiraceae bacterium]|nr:glycosyltransferase family 4 protein [Lachnospiraceae bacterium]